MKTSDYLKKYNVKLKKHLGQVFLSDDRIAKKIVELSNISPTDTVVEIGAGAGTLTEELAKTGAKVIAYEIDRDLEELLRERLASYSNVELRFEDFLKVESVPPGAVCVSNLPYSITGPLLEKIVRLGFPKAVIMVQKEVGDRILSESGKKTFGFLSAFVQTFYRVRKLLHVSKSHFVPNPEVDSVVIELLRKDVSVDPNELKEFLSIIFGKKRKTLKNNLKPFLHAFDGVDLSRRAEQLTLEEIAELFERWRKVRGCSRE